MEKTNKNIVMAGIMIGTFLTAIEGTVVSTAMPKIASDLHGIQLMNWVFSIYFLVTAITVPIFGKLSDLFGRKIVFIIGTIVFLIGSALCGASHSMEQLIIFRAIQGIGAGAIMPVSTTIIGDIYPMEKRAKMFGLIGMIWGVAGILGPLVGGFFVDQVSWHWIFYINIPFGIISMILVGTALKETLNMEKKSIDIFGAGSFAISMFALLFALQKAGEDNQWLSAPIMSLFVCFIVFMALFLFIESKVKDPIIPLRLFRLKIISLANVIAFFTSAFLIGLNVYLPIWLQGLLGLSATNSGFILTPMSITWMLGSFLCGRLLLNRGAKITSIFGAGVLIIGSFWLTLLTISSSQIQFYIITAILGISFGLLVTLCTVCVQSAVDWNMRGAATASNMFFRNLGQTIGVAILGTYFNSKLSSALMARKDSDTHVGMNQLNELINPQSTHALTKENSGILKEVLASGIHHVFIIMLALAIIAILFSFFLPQLKTDPRHQKEANRAE